MTNEIKNRVEEEKSESVTFTASDLTKILGAGATVEGNFYNTLTKNHREIKETQARQMTINLEFAYRNKITSIANELQNLMLSESALNNDLLPSQTTSLKFENFNADNHVKSRVEKKLDIRDKSIELNAYLKAYKEDFGKDFIIT